MPAVTVDALLQFGTAIISTVLSLDEHLSHANTWPVQKFCYQLVYSCIIPVLLRCHDTPCEMLQEQQQTISMRSNVRK
jgi:hypothetical protein